MSNMNPGVAECQTNQAVTTFKFRPHPDGLVFWWLAHLWYR
jgi:hypothetical protein